MKAKFLGLALITVLALLSCQKELSYTSDSDPVPEQKNGLLSKRITEVPDLTLIDSFEYDSKNRCTRLYSDGIIGPGPYVVNYFYDFYYMGDEMQPYKITDTSQGRDMVWWIEYDGQKRKILDSVDYFGMDDLQVTRYAYLGNRITASTTLYHADTVIGRSKDTFDLDGNNCIRYVGFGEGMGQVPDYWWQYTMTHDNKINPLSKLNIAKSVLFGSSWTELGDFDALNKNNYITATFSSTTSPGPSGTITNQYVYDADGYPVSASGNNSADPTWFVRIKYYYNK